MHVTAKVLLTDRAYKWTFWEFNGFTVLWINYLKIIIISLKLANKKQINIAQINIVLEYIQVHTNLRMFLHDRRNVMRTHNILVKKIKLSRANFHRSKKKKKRYCSSNIVVYCLYFVFFFVFCLSEIRVSNRHLNKQSTRQTCYYIRPSRCVPTPNRVRANYFTGNFYLFNSLFSIRLEIIRQKKNNRAYSDHVSTRKYNNFVRPIIDFNKKI